jgi:hypothetical protein
MSSAVSPSPYLRFPDSGRLRNGHLEINTFSLMYAGCIRNGFTPALASDGILEFDGLLTKLESTAHPEASAVRAENVIDQRSP